MKKKSNPKQKTVPVVGTKCEAIIEDPCPKGMIFHCLGKNEKFLLGVCEGKRSLNCRILRSENGTFRSLLVLKLNKKGDGFNSFDATPFFPS